MYFIAGGFGAGISPEPDPVRVHLDAVAIRKDDGSNLPGVAMTIYRVDFSNDWIKGRWGFTDRVFFQLKGKEADSSGVENAWMLNYRGSPSELGDLLADLLNIQPRDFQRFGTIFEIAVLEMDRDKMPERPKTRSEPNRPPWERQDKRRFPL